jgi:hypothetical protein
MRVRTLMLTVVLAMVAAGCTSPTADPNENQGEPALSQSAPPVPVVPQTTASDSTGDSERGGSGGFGSGH